MKYLERWGTALAGLALIGFFMLFAGNFAAPANLINILRDTSFLAILALGFALALTTGELDLSVAEVASLSAVVAGGCIQHGVHPVLAGLAALGDRDGAGGVQRVRRDGAIRAVPDRDPWHGGDRAGCDVHGD